MGDPCLARVNFKDGQVAHSLESSCSTTVTYLHRSPITLYSLLLVPPCRGPSSPATYPVILQRIGHDQHSQLVVDRDIMTCEATTVQTNWRRDAYADSFAVLKDVSDARCGWVTEHSGARRC